MSIIDKFERSLNSLPVVAIIRGVGSDEVVDVAQAIYEAGITIIEVPLNTPNAFECIARLSSSMKDKCTVGCGTLVQIGDVPKVVDAGIEIAVTPSVNSEIIEECLKRGLIPMPGWMTPTEAFAAVHAGAQYLKLFPAATVGPAHVKAVKDVLPKHIDVFAVGGVKLEELSLWKSVGVRGFGFGGEIFSPGIGAEEVHKRARNVVTKVSKVYAS